MVSLVVYKGLVHLLLFEPFVSCYFGAPLHILKCCANSFRRPATSCLARLFRDYAIIVVQFCFHIPVLLAKVCMVRPTA
jgi:hypothetical protein